MNPASLSNFDSADIAWECFSISPSIRCARYCSESKPEDGGSKTILVWAAARLEPFSEPVEGLGWTDASSNLPVAWPCWRKSNAAGDLHVAVIPSEMILDRLLAEFGAPPRLILEDWAKQCKTHACREIMSRPLTSIAVSPDGLLQPVSDVYVRNSDATERNSVDSVTKLWLDRCEKTVIDQWELPNSDAHSVQTLSSFFADHGLASKANDLYFANRNESKSRPLAGQSSKVPGKRFSKQKMSGVQVALYAAATILVAGGGYFLYPNSRPSPSFSGSTNLASNTEANGAPQSLSDISNDFATSSVGDKEQSIEDMQPNSSADLQQVTSTELKLTDIGNSSSGTSLPTVNLDANADLQSKLMKDLSSSIALGDGSIDQSTLTSVEDLLTKPIASESKSIEADRSALSQNDLMSLDKDFSNEAAEPSDTTEASIADDQSNLDPSSIQVTENLTDQSSTANWTAKKPIQKEEFRVPFAVNSRLSGVKVAWDFPSEMLITPEAPIVLTGKHDQTWTMALKDESSKLAVTIKSKPGRKWLLGIVVKVKLPDGTEIPIAPNDAKIMQQQYQQIADGLSKKIEFLEVLKGARNGRAFAYHYLPMFQASLKETEASIEHWRQVDDLTTEFYRSHKMDLQFLADAKQQ